MTTDGWPRERSNVAGARAAAAGNRRRERFLSKLRSPGDMRPMQARRAKAGASDARAAALAVARAAVTCLPSSASGASATAIMPTHAQKRLAVKAEAAAAVSAAARPDADVVLVSATRGARATKGRRGPGHPMCDRRAGNMFQVKGCFQQDHKLTVIVKVGKSKT